MAILYLIHGYIGSGKTTFAKKLEAETGAIRYTPDEWVIKAHSNNPPSDIFDKIESDARAQIIEEGRKMLVQGRDVIFDFGLWTRSERDRLRELGKNLGADVRLYAILTDMEIAKQRTLDRTQKMPYGALFIDENAFEILKEKFEPLGADEANIIIEASSSR